MARLILRILLIISFVVSCIWLYKEPGYEPMLAVLGALGIFLEDSRNNNELPPMSFVQRADKNSIAQQAGKNLKNENSFNNTTNIHNNINPVIYQEPAKEGRGMKRLMK
ncbi:MAG: hypothetical protein EOO61_19125 [Hymenobacter sp.]|nr:MAG: hypothetical protein EOO61_19125 [Hymenobacter sp.]